MRCLLDTDIVSEIMKARHAQILRRAATYLRQNSHFFISAMTRYEVLRGLKAKRATTRLATFETWCQVHQVLPITDDVLELASDLYAGLHQSGRLIGDNDPIIAATALHHGLAVATRNVAHFGRIPGLMVEDWTIP